ncbi:Alpha/Beta hydrolase protein [Rhexocercosporidium sp. MPI-PUGE-AT-0058]|nr:Alpha/Beta hydrolase protein [Rhexocercosporidium sp. MPI-PUGE-AT-0058]
MRSSITTILLLTASSLAAPTSHTHSRSTFGPKVTVKNGTYSGIYNPTYNQDEFLGIPYALPPINSLRFSVPQPLNTTWNETREATAYPPFCAGYGPDNIGHEISEDCLYLSIIRPAGIKSHKKLPVALWIHGGGLLSGGSNDPRYNLSYIVSNSIQMDRPMLAINIQYRLSAFGFLNGKEALEGGATNLGFRDQRLALHWVRENIGFFGGDKDKVTIWGESSGAQSVGAQLLAYNGRDDKLFRAGIAQSGGPANSFFPLSAGYNSSDGQTAYNLLVTNTSCSSTLNSIPDTTLSCLRALPFTKLNGALNIPRNRFIFPFAPTIDGDFIATYPSVQLSQGNFVKVPLLIGANSDEGSSFGARYGAPNTTAQFLSILNTVNLISPSSTAASILAAVYPAIPALGIPSLTTYPDLGPSSSLVKQFGTQARRLFAYFGDITVIAPRRASSLAWSASNVPSYAYRFDVTVNGIPRSSGATHFQEVAFVFNNTLGIGYATNPFANTTRAFEDLAVQMSRSWVAFVTTLDPNNHGLQGVNSWPVYNATTGEDFVFTVNSSSFAEPDTFRAEAISWISENALGVYGR